MGFKARARKTKAESGKDDKAKAKKNVGETACALKSCEKWADKKLGGRSLSFDDATECGGVEVSPPPRDEYASANPVTDLGRRKTRMMTCIDVHFHFSLTPIIKHQYRLHSVARYA